MLSNRQPTTRFVSKFGIVGLLSLYTGCTTTPGARSSIWPTKKLTATAPAPAGTGLASFAAKTKDQLSTVGTAFNSAYEKTKTAITYPFTATSTSASTAASTTSATTSPNSIGPELHVMTGQLNESKGDYKAALNNYSKALEIDPKNTAALIATARLYDRQNERDKAISFYQKATEISPTAATFAELGGIYAKSGNLNAAKDELQKAVNLEPMNASHRSALAGVLLDLGRQDAALEELMQVHQAPMANYQMAYLHFTRKNVPATQQYLGTALQLDPNLKPARDLMASIGGGQSVQQLAQQGNQWLNQAQSTLQQAAAVGNNIQGLWPQTTSASQANQPTTGTTSVASSTAFALPQPPSQVK